MTGTQHVRCAALRFFEATRRLMPDEQRELQELERLHLIYEDEHEQRRCGLYEPFARIEVSDGSHILERHEGRIDSVATSEDSSRRRVVTITFASPEPQADEPIVTEREGRP